MTAPDALRPPTAARLLAIWRKVAATEESEMARGLLCNANVLAESCFSGGERLFDSAEAVLEALTAREMEGLLKRLAKEPLPALSGGNPEFDEARFQTLRGERA